LPWLSLVESEREFEVELAAPLFYGAK